jgi:hypothetical protein
MTLIPSKVGAKMEKKNYLSPLTIHLTNKRGEVSSDGSLMGSSVIVGSS